MIIFIYYNKSISNYNELQEITPPTYTEREYKVLDRYGLPGYEAFRTIIRKKHIIDTFTELRSKLYNAENFIYHEVYDSLLQYIGYYTHDKIFIHEYGKVGEDDLDQFINQEIKRTSKSVYTEGKEIKKEPENIYLTNLKSTFVGEKYFNENLKENISIGRGFESQDFIYGDVVKVILGSKYKDIYNIGDKLTTLYLTYTLTLEVVGFLDSNAMIQFGENSISLDSYILIPSFEFEVEQDIDKLFYAMHYSNKTLGFITIPENKSIDEAINEFDKIIKNLGLEYGCFPLSH